MELRNRSTGDDAPQMRRAGRGSEPSGRDPSKASVSAQRIHRVALRSAAFDSLLRPALGGFESSSADARDRVWIEHLDKLGPRNRLELRPEEQG